LLSLGGSSTKNMDKMCEALEVRMT
jgi:hypothetical protein